MKFEPIDLNKVKTISIKERKSKVKVEGFARAVSAGGSFSEFLNSLPKILAGKDLRDIIEAIVTARQLEKPVIFALGAHVIKCGLSPIIIQLMQKDVISCLALNGAGAIHDVEIALFGQTSEYVEETIKEGTFGMTKETAQFINQTISQGVKTGLGFGESLGKRLLELKPPFINYSLLASACELNLPATVHIALGTDVVHMHPEANGAAIGKASQADFKTFASVFVHLGGGGVIVNIGSAVILPMVIEKALALSRNLGYEVSEFVGVNLDFIRHYRASINPVKRAEDLGGKGYSLIGHHELLIPLLAAGILERIAKNPVASPATAGRKEVSKE